MNLPLKRFAAVLLTVCVLGVAAESVYAAGNASHPHPGSQPPPKPQPQPQPVKKEWGGSNIIGTLAPDKPGQQPMIGTLAPQKSGQQPMIGTLAPQKSGQQPMIGTLAPDKPQPQPQPRPQPKPKNEEPEQHRPQDNPPPEQTRPQDNPQPQSHPAAALQKPAEPEPQVVQEAPKQAQVQDPIIITPHSVRAGNTSSGRSPYRDVPGYSGGDGSGPLIYNP